MLVRFVKGSASAKADVLRCIRDDGTETSGTMPRQGILPHDVFHYVVETTLGWPDAFFGRIADGAELDQLAAKVTRRQPDWARWPRALQAESLVECLQAEQWGGPVDPETFRRTLATSCRVRKVAPPAIADRDLARIRVALREFGAAWRPLPPGQVLARAFPATCAGVAPDHE